MTPCPAWSETPPVERARVSFRYRQLMEENFAALCQCVSREHGRTPTEARGRCLESMNEPRMRTDFY